MNILSNVTNSVSNMYGKASDLCRSRWVRAVATNGAEAAAGVVGRELLSPVGRAAGESLGGGAAIVTVIGATGVVARYSDEALAARFPTMPSDRRHIIVVVTAVGMAYVVNSLLTEMMTGMGGVVGEVGFGLLGTVLAGYAALRYLGSEVDINRYAASTTFSTTASTAFELCVPGNGPVARVGALATGAIVYHLVDSAEFAGPAEFGAQGREVVNSV